MCASFKRGYWVRTAATSRRLPRAAGACYYQGAMEFDADWIWIAIFVGVMLVRGLGSRLARAARKSEPGVAEATRNAEFGSGPPDQYHAESEPKPIEPR